MATNKKVNSSGEEFTDFPETMNILKRLFTLSYVRAGEHSSQRILLLPSNNVGEAVRLGQNYCKQKELRFLFIRPTIEKIEFEEIENQ